MSDYFLAGSVWWSYLDFDDGRGPTKKYFVFLSNCTNDGGQGAIALTTSRTNRYPEADSSSPCSPRYSAFRIKKGEETCFPDETWVQFNNTRAVSQAGLEKAIANGVVGYHGKLAEQRLRAILNCARKAIDIEGWAAKLAERTLKNMPSSQAAPRAIAAPIVASGIVEIQAWYDAACNGCRIQFCELTMVSMTQLSRVFARATIPPDTFLADAALAVGMVRDASGDSCTCLTRIR